VVDVDWYRATPHGAPDLVRSLRAEIDSYDRTIREIESELAVADGPKRLELHDRWHALMLVLDRRRLRLEQLLASAGAGEEPTVVAGDESRIWLGPDRRPR
jgi:hypothetical protein